MVRIKNTKNHQGMQTDLRKFVKSYYDNCKPLSRHVAFDYCYNYFHRTEDLTVDMEKSCLVLGFYLASWGMFRGKLLLWKSLKHYVSTIEFIAKVSEELRELEVDSYESDAEIIVDIYNEICDRIRPESDSRLILGTKVMLGVFGSVPAFDGNFQMTFKLMFPKRISSKELNIKSLLAIKQFYDANQDEIDKLSAEMCTIDFGNGQSTELHYTKAKIIDMYGWQKAYEKAARTNVTVYPSIKPAKRKLVDYPKDNPAGSNATKVMGTIRSAKSEASFYGMKKAVMTELLSTPYGATYDEIAQAFVDRGIDLDFEKNRRVAQAWRGKIGFEVEKLLGNRYRKV
jgi:hypothetical protein